MQERKKTETVKWTIVVVAIIAAALGVGILSDWFGTTSESQVPGTIEEQPADR